MAMSVVLVFVKFIRFGLVIPCVVYGSGGYEGGALIEV
jgi:hypothetical protein